MYATGLSWLASLVRRRCACVLAYHSIEDPVGSRVYPNNCVPPAAFARQVAYLARRRRVVPLDDLVDACRGKRPYPAAAAAITFDDGYRSVFTTALPVLRRHRLPAVLYLVTDRTGDGRPKWDDVVVHRLAGLRGGEFVGAGLRLPLRTRAEFERASLAVIARALDGAQARAEILAGLGEDTEDGLPGRTLVDWEECRAMAREGFAFGSHTATHEPLHPRPAEEIAREIRRSRDALERELGTPPRHFCPPLGASPPDLRARLEACGFVSAVSARKGLLPPGADPFALRRVSPRYFEPHFVFVMRVHGSYEWIERTEAALRGLVRRARGDARAAS